MPINGEFPFGVLSGAVSLKQGLSEAAFIPSPGEISPVHHGVLILDKVPKFWRKLPEVERWRSLDRENRAGQAIFLFRFLPAGRQVPFSLNGTSKVEHVEGKLPEFLRPEFANVMIKLEKMPVICE